MVSRRLDKRRDLGCDGVGDHSIGAQVLRCVRGVRGVTSSDVVSTRQAVRQTENQKNHYTPPHAITCAHVRDCTSASSDPVLFAACSD